MLFKFIRSSTLPLGNRFAFSLYIQRTLVCKQSFYFALFAKEIIMKHLQFKSLELLSEKDIDALYIFNIYNKHKPLINGSFRDISGPAAVAIDITMFCGVKTCYV
jgi:hypothetical protein